MSWVIFALLGALFWALVHHLDKLLLTKFSLHYGIGSLVVFSSLFPALVLPILLLITGMSPFAAPIESIAILIGAGVLGAIAALCYFHALETDETTIVVSMYQLSPVFGFVLGFVFLGEALASIQIIGALVTILGVTILSFEFLEEKRIQIRSKTTTLMVAAAFIYALGDVVYKGAVVGQVSYLAAMFWVFVGYIIFGIAALVMVREYRENVLAVFRNRHHTVLGLNLLNECFQTAGVMFTAYAILLAPVALVLVMDSYQPVLVFALGIILTIFAPALARERLSIQHFLQKSIAILIAILGTVLMQQL